MSQKPTTAQLEALSTEDLWQLRAQIADYLCVKIPARLAELEAKAAIIKLLLPRQK